jgi:hypothetical protein
MLACECRKYININCTYIHAGLWIVCKYDVTVYGTNERRSHVPKAYGTQRAVWVNMSNSGANPGNKSARSDWCSLYGTWGSSMTINKARGDVTLYAIDSRRRLYCCLSGHTAFRLIGTDPGQMQELTVQTWRDARHQYGAEQLPLCLTNDAPHYEYKWTRH